MACLFPVLFDKASVESPIVDAETKTKKVNSLFGTLTLGYKDTYYLEATGRNDWSSTLPSMINHIFILPWE